jgi:hypothetical protein
MSHSSDMQIAFIESSALTMNDDDNISANAAANAQGLVLLGGAAASDRATASSLGENPYTAVNGSATVTVTDPNIVNYAVGQTVVLTGTTGKGVTIAGTYKVQSIDASAGTFTITNSANANDDGAFGGSSATATYKEVDFGATARTVTLTAAGNESSKTFTIFGEDSNGDALTETITGPNATTATFTKLYTKIFGIECNEGASVGNIKFGVITANDTVGTAIFGGDMRLREFYITFPASAAAVEFRSVSENGTTFYKYQPPTTSADNDRVSVPEDGLLIKSGTYIVCDLSLITNITVFYA